MNAASQLVFKSASRRTSKHGGRDHVGEMTSGTKLPVRLGVNQTKVIAGSAYIGSCARLLLLMSHLGVLSCLLLTRSPAGHTLSSLLSEKSVHRALAHEGKVWRYDGCPRRSCTVLPPRSSQRRSRSCSCPLTCWSRGGCDQEEVPDWYSKAQPGDITVQQYHRGFTFSAFPVTITHPLQQKYMKLRWRRQVLLTRSLKRVRRKAFIHLPWDASCARSHRSSSLVTAPCKRRPACLFVVVEHFVHILNTAHDGPIAQVPDAQI